MNMPEVKSDLKSIITRGTIIYIGGPLILLSFLFILIVLSFVAPEVYAAIVNTIREIVKALLGQ